MEMVGRAAHVQADGPQQVEQVLKAFVELGKEDSVFEEQFQKIKSLYASLSEPEKEALFSSLIQGIEVAKETLAPLISELSGCEKGDPRWPGLLSELRSRAYSPRLRLFRKISHASGGLKFLLDFRGDLLSLRRHTSLDLFPLDSDIVFLLEMLFQEGFLYLEEITLNSSYNQIAMIKNSDMVHPMASIEEMGQRLGRDRRCFVLYHRLLPHEPIVFIEVALTEGLVRTISDIIMNGPAGEGRKGRIDTAVFYSINNTQNGLAGLGLGKILIGKVVEYLRSEDERIKNFATLSPIPGFWTRYLKPVLEGKDENFSLKRGEVAAFFQKKGVENILSRGKNGDGASVGFAEALLRVLETGDWINEEELCSQLHQPMVRLAYHYISNEKNRQGKPLNPVAGFHLGNGATVSVRNVNFLANPSSRGLKESCGMMVNYIYTSSWLSQIRRSLRRFEMVEIKGLFSRQ